MDPILVADIGGTNARFALVAGRRGARFEITHRRDFRTADHATFDECLAAYASDLDVAPTGACLAVAGPVADGKVQMTNVDWRIVAADIRRQFGIEHADLVNDFVAMAFASVYIDPEQLRPIKPGTPRFDRPRLIIGPGTGLGVAALIPGVRGWRAVPGEGGHIRCPRYECIEPLVWAALTEADPELTTEHLLSGRGLVRLRHALARVEGVSAQQVAPADVTSGALSDPNSIDGQAVTLMCDILGAAARDYALIYGALGGVYLGGGILPRIIGLLEASRFKECFVHHARYGALLEEIPITLMEGADCALTGAAGCFLETHHIA